MRRKSDPTPQKVWFKEKYLNICLFLKEKRGEP